LRGNYLPSYLNEFAQDNLSENIYNKAAFRTVDDISILGTDSGASGTMDIQIQGEVVEPNN